MTVFTVSLSGLGSVPWSPVMRGPTVVSLINYSTIPYLRFELGNKNAITPFA